MGASNTSSVLLGFPYLMMRGLPKARLLVVPSLFNTPQRSLPSPLNQHTYTRRLPCRTLTLTLRAKANNKNNNNNILMAPILPILLPIVASFLLFFVATLLLMIVHPTWLVRWVQQRVPNVLFLKVTQDKIVALTIDDGPHEEITPELLDILKENECRATWFIIGSNMDACPDLVTRIHNEGHEVGNHTMYDVPSWRLSERELKDQLLNVDGQLSEYYFKDSQSKPIKWFRPGHGFYTRRMLQVVEAHGYKTALGSLFPLDTSFTNQGQCIAQYLLWRRQEVQRNTLSYRIYKMMEARAQMFPGAIIVLHDRHPQKKQTAQVLRVLLPALKQRGYSIVCLSELLGYVSNAQEI